MQRSNVDARWVFPVWLALLTISVLINYVDRGNLAVAAPLLKDELHISTMQMGVLITAFFWTYTAVMTISGWIIDRFDVNWVLAAGFLVWSLATAATGLVHTFFLLIMFRMLLGAGESVAFPSYGKIIAQNVPQQHRGVANAAIIAGMSLGPAVGTYACGMSMAHFGWRPVFLVIGLISLLWIVPWMRYKPENAITEERKMTPVSALDIFRERNFWAAALGQFCSNYPFYFMIVWLPLYLVHERHLSMQHMSVEAACYYLAFAITASITGWIADACISSGWDVSQVRKTGMAVGHSLIVAGVLMCGAASDRLSFAGLIVMGVGSGFVGPNVYLFAQTLAGPRVAGKWTAFQNSFANLAGVVVGPLTGWIVDRSGHFAAAFVICAVFSALGAIFWVLLMGRLEQIQWRAEPEPAQAASQAA